MMQTYAVPSDGAISIAPSGLQPQYTLRNTGDVVVYASDVNAVGRGYPIEPGNSLGWKAGVALYASAASGTGSLLVMDTGDILAPTTVNVSGPVDANITGPVTADISGPVTVTGGVSIVGSGTILRSGAKSGSTGPTDWYDVSAYDSLTVTVQAYRTSGAATALSTVGTLSIEWGFLDDLDVAHFFETDLSTMYSNTPTALVSGQYTIRRLPVLAPLVRVNVNADVPLLEVMAVTGAPTVDDYVATRWRGYDTSRQSVYLASTDAAPLPATLINGSGGDIHLSPVCRSGRARISVAFGTTFTGAFTIACKPTYDTAAPFFWRYQWDATPDAAACNFDVVFPRAPYTILLANRSGVSISVQSLSITWD